jgi:hypothetical protein
LPHGVLRVGAHATAQDLHVAPWSTPTVFTEFAAIGGAQEDPWMSPDMRIFSFVSNVSGTKDQYIVTR